MAGSLGGRNVGAESGPPTGNDDRRCSYAALGGLRRAGNALVDDETAGGGRVGICGGWGMAGTAGVAGASTSRGAALGDSPSLVSATVVAACVALDGSPSCPARCAACFLSFARLCRYVRKCEERGKGGLCEPVLKPDLVASNPSVKADFYGIQGRED